MLMRMNGPTKRKKPPQSKSEATKSNFAANDLTHWYQRCEPTTVEKLALHTAKVNEVRTWFTNWCRRNATDDGHFSYAAPTDDANSRIALLTGPAGSGKTTVVKLLCKDLRIALEEFTDEDIRRDETNDDDDIFQYGDFNESQLKQFKDYLIRHNRRKFGLMNQSDYEHKVILFEEFPPGFYYSPFNYQNVLREVVKAFKSTHIPIVFIISDMGESSESLTEGESRCKMASHTLFPQTFINEMNITHIKFNPVAKTFIHKALKQLPNYDAFSKVNKQVHDHVCSLGDIRSAFNFLEFNYYDRFCSLPTVNGKKPRIQTFFDDESSQRPGNSRNELTTRDRLDTSFHFIGKIIYSKRIVPADFEWPKRIRDLPTIEDINELIRKSPVTPSHLLLRLQQMYSKPCGHETNQSARIIEAYSLADHIAINDYSLGGPNLLLQEIQSEIAVRSTMFHVYPSLIMKDGGKFYGSTPWPSPPKNRGFFKQSKIEYFSHMRNQKKLQQNARDTRETLFPSLASLYTLDYFFLDLLLLAQLNGNSDQAQNESLDKFFNLAKDLQSELKANDDEYDVFSTANYFYGIEDAVPQLAQPQKDFAQPKQIADQPQQIADQPDEEALQPMDTNDLPMDTLDPPDDQEAVQPQEQAAQPEDVSESEQFDDNLDDIIFDSQP